MPRPPAIPRPRPPRALGRPAAWTVAAFLAAVHAGCGTPAGPLLVPGPGARTWPPPPDPARVRYAGQFSTEADLKAGKSGIKALGDAIFGEDPPRTLQTPMAVCTDGAGRVFIADSTAGVVHVMNLETREYAQWRTPAERVAAPHPVALAYDRSGPGRLLVADPDSGTVGTFDPAGAYTGEFGREHLHRPCGIAIDDARQVVYVVDVSLHQVVALGLDGRELARLGHRGNGPDEFNFPTNVAVDSRGRLYVSDSLNFRVLVFDPDLTPVRQIGRKGDMPGYFSQPKGMSIGPGDRLFVVDANFEAVQVFDHEGTLLMAFGSEGHAQGEFWLPAGVHVDSLGRVWVADSFNRRVQVFEQLPGGDEP